MATKKQAAYTNRELHTVGNLNSMQIRTLNHGAKCTEDVDNFTFVELAFDADGVRTAKSLAAVGNKSYLIASPERRYMNEEIDEFYNGQDEFARIVHLDQGLRFESSAFELDASVASVAAGDSAHFNPATKKFIIHDGTHVDFAGADVKLLVVANEEDTDYTLGHPTVRFEVQ